MQKNVKDTKTLKALVVEVTLSLKNYATAFRTIMGVVEYKKQSVALTISK